MPQVTMYANKNGYYRSGEIYKFSGRSLLNRWEPWNPTVELVLKKKRNPVGMYAKNTGNINAPVVNSPVGYDLEKGDWVTPYGKGLVSDFIFTLITDYESNSRYYVKLILSFSNEKDGIQEFYPDQEQSIYKWPFEAPGNDYKDLLMKEKSDSPEKGFSNTQKEKVQYIFRVRTVLDKDGNIIEAKYGKIPVEFGFDPFGSMGFTYYFNPDGTNNIEFNPDKNLFKWGREEWEHEVKNP